MGDFRITNPVLGASEAQFNANQLQGIGIEPDTSTLNNGDVFIFNAARNTWEYELR